jgi:hypothetical protein
MHIKIQGVVKKCLLLDIKKEEDMSWKVCKENLGRLSHHPLMVKEKGKMMLKHGCFE